MKVIATDYGFYGGARKRRGDVFDVPDGEKAAWFEPASSAVADIVRHDDGPSTLSELSASAVEDSPKPKPRPKQ